MVSVSVTVDGVRRTAEVEPRTLLVHLLRAQFGRVGTVVGCETSNCGACTVLLDGVSVKSCSVLAAQADGATVDTIQGLAAPDGTLHPIQQAFHENHGLQCGFCTPGMVMRTVSLLKENPSPTEEEIREGINGNLCRCTGYQGIVSAIQAAASVMASGPDAAASSTASEAEVSR